MVGVHNANEWNAQFFGFQDGDLVVTHVNHENGIWQSGHVLNATDVFFKLLDFTFEHELFFFAQGVEADFLLSFHVFQALDGSLDSLEIGEHAAQPALVHVRNAGALGFSCNGFTGLALGTHHEDVAAVCRELFDELQCILEHRQRFFQVDDVNFVAVTEDEGGHLGVPEASLVTKVDTGFQHFAHGNGHIVSPKVGSKIRLTHWLYETCPREHETHTQHLEGAGLRLTCRVIPAKPVEYSIPKRSFSSPFHSHSTSFAQRHTMRQDLIATLQALSSGQTTQQAEWAKSQETARSLACKEVFLKLAEAETPAFLNTPGLANTPLKGLAFSVKDLFDVAGQPTLAGSKVLDGQSVATSDCTAVARLQQAGGAFLGRTNMVEFAFSGVGINPHYGTPAAWDALTDQPVLSQGQAHAPGGSSSGAAVSVATGAAFIGLGSDTGGSIRIPAALNGIVGFKNTARRVPTTGAVPLSTTMDTVCAMTRSVRDAILAHEILSARNVARSKRPLSSYRLAVPTSLMFDGIDTGIQKAWERSLSQLSKAGAQLIETPMAEINALAGLLATGGFSAAESFTWHRHLLAANEAAYDPRVAARILRGGNMKAFEYLDLQKGRAEWIQKMQAALNFYDAAISPTVPVYGPTIESVAPGKERDEAFFAVNGLLLRNTSVVNMLDGCALSLPMHVAGELPSSLMVWQGPMHDDTVLNISLTIEDALRA